jgi:hypothetical protein
MREANVVNAATGNQVWDIDPVDVRNPPTHADIELLLDLIRRVERANPGHTYRAVWGRHPHPCRLGRQRLPIRPLGQRPPVIHRPGVVSSGLHPRPLVVPRGGPPAFLTEPAQES